MCAAQARHACEMSNDILMMLSAQGDPAARRERMIREVMFVDQLSWPDAACRVTVMSDEVQKDLAARMASSLVGLASLGMGAASIPMVFHRATALQFNERFVTTDVPPPEDLET